MHNFVVTEENAHLSKYLLMECKNLAYMKQIEVFMDAILILLKILLLHLFGTVSVSVVRFLDCIGQKKIKISGYMIYRKLIHDLQY